MLAEAKRSRTGWIRAVLALVGLGAALAYPAASAPAEVAPAAAARVVRYGDLPLRFEANLGQADPVVRFLARGRGYTTFVTSTEAVLVLGRAGDAGVDALSALRTGARVSPAQPITVPRSVVRMVLVGSNRAAEASADTPAGVANYFIGADPSRWLRGVPTFGRVRVRSVYPGVDVVYYGRQEELEYDFVLAPGADPTVIALAFEGVERARDEGDGDVLLRVAGGELRLRRPVVYQEVAGVRRPVAAGYRVVHAGRDGGRPLVSFRVAAYDTSRPLVIDPVLSYSTVLGGTAGDAAGAIAVDAAGSAYVAGYTDSIDFPQVGGPYGDQGGTDAFVTKLSPDGLSIVYSTYLGGGASDAAAGIAVDSAGNAYVTGATDSIDFPTTAGAYGLDQGFTDAFVAKLSSDGTTLLYATYLGGSGIDVGLGIAADAGGRAWVTGFTESSDFPTQGALQTAQGGRDAFVTKLDTTASGAASLVYSTYLGTAAADEGHGIAVDAAGNAHVTGVTVSTTGFPVSANARQTASGGGLDAFVSKLNASGSGILYSTYFGGSGDDAGAAVAIDAASIYVAGSTDSTNFPLKANLQADQPGTDAFVAKFNPASSTGSSSLLYSTYLGGSDTDTATGIAVNGEGAVFVTGITRSSDFPGTGAIQGPGGGEDAFVAKLNLKVGGAPSMVYSTWLGGAGDDMGFGVAVGPRGNAYVVGASQSGQDAFVVKLSEPDLFMTAFTVAPVSPGAEVVVTDTVKNQGDAPAGETSVKYFFSTDLTLGADDLLLGSRVLPALAATATSTATTTLTGAPLPSPLTPGTYYVIAQVDPDNAVAEAVEGNNKFARTITVGPDLAVSALSFTQAGANVSVTDTTINQGASDAGASTTGYVLSTASTLGAGVETPLGSRAIGTLTGGTPDTATTVLTIPPATTAGSYFLIAQADSGNAVPESNETNNTRSKSITIGADLTVSALALTGAGGAGTTVTAADTTTNAGAVTAVMSTTRFYLSSDGTVHPTDPVLGARAVPSLNPGAASSGSTSLVIPADTVTGSYFIVAVADADLAVSEANETNNTRNRSLKVGPNLAVSYLNAPAAATVGANITVSDTTKNIGGGPAEVSTTRYFLTTDGTVRPGDPVLLSRSVPALAAGTQSLRSTSVTVPAGVAAGSYVIVTVADADNVIVESAETDNTRSKAITLTAAPTPDLVVTALGVPSLVTAGPSIAVTSTVANQGSATAPASVMSFYLSSDTTIHPADALLGNRSVPSLGVGASSAGSATLTLPADTPAGAYYVVAKADVGGLIVELSEANNTAAQPITIAPDLVVTLTAPVSVTAGATMSVSDTTKNIGGATAPASTTRYVLTADGTVQPSDPVLLSRAIPALAAGAGSAATTSVVVPGGTPPATYVLVAVADAEGVVAEGNESNDTASKSITVLAPGSPDLVFTAFTAPATAGIGASFSVSTTTKNQGTTSAVASVIRFYLSADGTLDPTDPLIGSRSVAALAAGASTILTASLTVPAGTAPGNYVIIAREDATDVVVETNETNNLATRAIVIGPDVVVTSLTVPSTAAPGQTISLKDTTKNAGAGSAVASTTRFYLSTDGIVDPGDLVLANRSVPVLSTGATNTTTTTTIVPGTAAPGSYFVIAVADADGVVAETVETNNTLVQPLTITGLPGDGPLSLLTQVPTGGAAYDVVLDSGFAYVANDDGLTVLELSVPTAPTVRGSVAVADVTGLVVRGSYVYMTSRAAGLVVIDVSNPDAPAVVTTLANPYAWAAAVKDDALYVSTATGKLLVFSIADPAHPVLLKTIGLPAWRSASLDATNLPKLNAYTTTGNAKATDVTVIGDMLFTVDWAYGRLYYYDVGTPTSPVFRGTHFAPYILKAQADPARDVVYMLSAYGTASGIYTVPISQLAPDRSTYHNTCSACGYLKSLAGIDQGGMHVVSGRHYLVYGGGRNNGEFHAVVTSDPDPAVMTDGAVTTIGPHMVPTEFSMGMKMSGDLVYVAAGVLGLQIYQFPGLSAP